jgi:hypothetical protein
MKEVDFISSTIVHLVQIYSGAFPERRTIGDQVPRLFTGGVHMRHMIMFCQHQVERERSTLAWQQALFQMVND